MEYCKQVKHVMYLVPLDKSSPVIQPACQQVQASSTGCLLGLLACFVDAYAC